MFMEETDDEKNSEVKTQCVETLAIFIFWNALKGIVGYIAVFLFRPLLDKVIKAWQKVFDKS